MASAPTCNDQKKEKKEFTVLDAVAKVEAQGTYNLDVLNFYSTFELPYGVFSNFWPCPFTSKGVSYKTSEAYFQAMKFDGTDKKAFDAVVSCENCMDVTKIGRDRSNILRPDWEAVKLDIMRDALIGKYLNHEDTLLKILMSTGTAKLVEHTKNDAFWGDGMADGGNWLGKLLVELREQLRPLNAEQRKSILKTFTETGVNLLRQQQKVAAKSVEEFQ